MNNFQAVDITAALLAKGAGTNLNLFTGDGISKIQPQGILISAPVNAIARVKATPIQGNAPIDFYLNTNEVHDIALQSIEKDDTTASPIVILGENR